MTTAAAGPIAHIATRWRRRILATAELVAHALSGLSPRSKKAWVFGNTGGQMFGNPKALFLWMHLHRPDISVVWLTHDEGMARQLRAHGLNGLYRFSWKGIVAALRAGVFVYANNIDALNFAASGRACLLNLWHGVGLKGVRLGYQGGGQAIQRRGIGAWKRFKAKKFLVEPDLLVTTSDFTQDHFMRQFGLPRERCPQLGYPRMDYGLDPEMANLANSLEQEPDPIADASGFDEVYVYMPTFRDSGRPFLAQAIPDPAVLSAVLARRNAVLFIKMHGHSRLRAESSFANIRPWPEAVDIYTRMANLTGVITDYSSVLYDYLLVRNRGIILYNFDYDEYMEKDRSLLYPYKANTAGLRVATFEQLCEALANGSALSPELDPQTEIIRQQFWGSSPRPSSPEIVDFVMKSI